MSDSVNPLDLKQKSVLGGPGMFGCKGFRQSASSFSICMSRTGGMFGVGGALRMSEGSAIGLNPQPQTLNPKHQPLALKPQPLIPQTLDPKPQP